MAGKKRDKLKIPRASIVISILDDPDYWCLIETGTRGQIAFAVFVALLMLSKRLNNGGEFVGPVSRFAGMIGFSTKALEISFEAIRAACKGNGNEAWITTNDTGFVLRSFPIYNPTWGGGRGGSGRPFADCNNQDAIKMRNLNVQDAPLDPIKMDLSGAPLSLSLSSSLSPTLRSGESFREKLPAGMPEAIEALDRWSNYPPPVGRHRAMSAARGETQTAERKLAPLSELPGIIHGGQIVGRLLLVSNAVEAAIARKVPFKSIAWAVTVIADQIDQWECGGTNTAAPKLDVAAIVARGMKPRGER